jgi:predicted outer membrane protein
LLLGNKEEVALAQFAQERTQNEQVKEFAQMMIEQHQQAIQQLEQAAPQVASMNLDLQAGQGASADGQNRQASTQRTGAAAQAGDSQGADRQMAEFAREVKQQCLQLTKAELGKKQGTEFDKAYMGQQLVAHTNMLAELQVSQKYASQKLQPIIKQGTQMTEHHLAQARSIKERLSAAGGAQAQRPATTDPARRQ